MTYHQIETGASPDQGVRALMQAGTCMAIIPPEQAERLVLAMPPMTEEQAFWLRMVLRSVDRAVARERAERGKLLADMLSSLVTAIAVGFVLLALMSLMAL